MAGPDVFDTLLSARWKNIEFPVTRMRVSVAHDLVEHRYWGIDGARVESTGLAPLRFTFSAPLLNGISPGKNERWAALYPNQMRSLLAAFQKKERGALQHPEFGLVFCKAATFDMDWDANRRGGVDAELSFVQTLTENEIELLAETPVTEVDIGDLDTETVKRDLKDLLKAKGVPLPPYLQDAGLSLTELAQKVKAVTDYPALLSYRSAGQIDALVYQANRIQESAEKARSPLTWPITQNVERIKASSHELKQKLLQESRTVALFTVPAPTTLAGVSRLLPNSKVGDLIRLNPGLMNSYEIDKGTVVRYYRAA